MKGETDPIRTGGQGRAGKDSWHGKFASGGGWRHHGSSDSGSEGGQADGFPFSACSPRTASRGTGKCGGKLKRQREQGQKAISKGERRTPRGGEQ